MHPPAPPAIPHTTAASHTAAAPTAASVSRRRILGACGGLAVVAAMAGAGAGATPAWAQARNQGLFRIATGTTGGTYFPLGTLVANAISNPPGTRPCDKGGSCGVPGLIAVAQATNGSVENIGLLQNGLVEAAMIQADVGWWAYGGKGIFENRPPFGTLRTLGTLYVESLHIVVPRFSTITTVADLKGKRVSLGEPGSGTLVDARMVLSAFGISEKELQASYLKPAASGDALADGSIDAFFMVGGPPVQAIKDLSTRFPINLVALEAADRDRLRHEQRFFVDAIIPEGTYPFVTVTPTVGVGAELMVRADRDPEFIYQVVKALWHERTRALVGEAMPAGHGIDVLNAVSGVSVPLHPGAERFYRESGLLGNPAGESGDRLSTP